MNARSPSEYSGGRVVFRRGWAGKRAEGTFSGARLIRRWAPFLVLGALSLAFSVQAADWPQWRGPERNGVAAGSELPEVLSAALERRWKVHVGVGQSSPIVVGDRVFILARQGEEEVVLALEASTGKELWRHACVVPYVPATAALQYGPGPKSTMLADGDSCLQLRHPIAPPRSWMPSPARCSGRRASRTSTTHRTRYGERRRRLWSREI